MRTGNRDLALTPAESAALSEFLPAVRSLLGGDLVEARLFGSRARGEGHEDSDLDLALVVSFSARARRYEVYDLAYDISLRHDVLLAPTLITTDALADMRRRELRFALDLDKEGILL